jgi:hypothetical protein
MEAQVMPGMTMPLHYADIRQIELSDKPLSTVSPPDSRTPGIQAQMANRSACLSWRTTEQRPADKPSNRSHAGDTPDRHHCVSHDRRGDRASSVQA